MGRPGGSLQHADLHYLNADNFSGARFIRMKRPLAFGVVEHEFWGVMVSSQQALRETHRLYTSGLVADDDIIYFRSELRKGLTTENTLAAYKTDDYYVFGSAVEKIRQSMARSYYNSNSAQFLAMVARPVLGQPCTLLADEIERELEAFD